MLRDHPHFIRACPLALDLPRLWLFTDERNDRHLAPAIRRLPRGSGIVFRHHHLSSPLRHARFETIKKLARRGGHMVLLAGPPALARRWRADGVHGRAPVRSATGRLWHSAPVHNAREIRKANRAGADIFFLSPVFATRSHVGQRPLNPLQVRRLAALCNGAVLLLGGMNRDRYRQRQSRLTHGWAAIDAFS